MRYVVELNDKDGNHFKMELHLPFLSSLTNTNNSTWRAMDSGYIKYHRGGCQAEKEFGHEPTNIAVCSGEHYGMRFAEFFDSLGLINSSGTGIIFEPWALNFNAGIFSWTLVS